MGGVDAAVEFGFSGTGYEGDFMTVIGTRGFDEFFLDFNALNRNSSGKASLMPLAKLPQPEPTSTIEHPHLPREAWILFPVGV